MDNQHEKISGYRDLTQEEIDLMNRVKALESELASLCGEIGTVDGIDQRNLALGRTNLQQGFMWTVRAIARPESNW